VAIAPTAGAATPGSVAIRAGTTAVEAAALSAATGCAAGGLVVGAGRGVVVDVAGLAADAAGGLVACAGRGVVTQTDARVATGGGVLDPDRCGAGVLDGAGAVGAGAPPDGVAAELRAAPRADTDGAPADGVATLDREGGAAVVPPRTGVENENGLDSRDAAGGLAAPGLATEGTGPVRGGAVGGRARASPSVTRLRGLSAVGDAGGGSGGAGWTATVSVAV